jgi:hypothetical protein
LRLIRWVFGVILGAVVIAAGSWLQIPTIPGLVLVPAPVLVWAARERMRPIGLAGVLIGLGASLGSLLVLVDAECSAANSGVGYYQELACVLPDLTAYTMLALSLLGGGAALTIIALRHRGRVSFWQASRAVRP